MRRETTPLGPACAAGGGLAARDDAFRYRPIVAVRAPAPFAVPTGSHIIPVRIPAPGGSRAA